MPAWSMFLAFPLLLTRHTSALQVTPNSPCTTLCMDSTALDISDPNASNTNNSDITCYDRDFTATSAGKKFQDCLTCLQSSSFSQGKENDQMWFLYNLRYNFDYCVFGFPNATGISISPCITSTACGPLEHALQNGDLDPGRTTQYSYCDADGEIMTSESFDKCLSCVAATGEQIYVANSLVALEAGCRQRPAAGRIVGLNDTVFSDHVIEIVDPNGSPDEADGHSSLGIGPIAGIVVGAVVLLLVVAAFFFIRHRKRWNRRNRSIPPPPSSLSFHCQMQLSPQGNKAFGNYEDASEDSTSVEQCQQPPAPPQRHITSSRPAAGTGPHWRPTNPMAGFQSMSPVSEEPEKSPRLPGEKGTPLHHITITTTNIPSAPRLPPAAHASPQSGTRASPLDPFATPTSSTSTKSTSNLLPALKPYVPSDFNNASVARPNALSPDSAHSQDVNMRHGWPSPQVGRGSGHFAGHDDGRFSWQTDTSKAYGDASRKVSPGGFGVGGLRRARDSTGPTSPVETGHINLSFPGPPAPRK